MSTVQTAISSPATCSVELIGIPPTALRGQNCISNSAPSFPLSVYLTSTFSHLYSDSLAVIDIRSQTY